MPASRRRRRRPYVLIVGGGQGGIALAARLKRLGVPAVVVEKNERAGDSWRKRYASLCLHDPVWYDHMPYLPFPEHWPVFTPKDRMGDWLEMYVKVMELDYRSFHASASRRRFTKRRELGGRPAEKRRAADAAAEAPGARHRHVRLSAASRTIPGIEEFAGTVVHSSKFEGGAAWKDKQRGGRRLGHLGARHLPGPARARRGAGHHDPARAEHRGAHREPDGARLGPALFGAGGGARRQHRDRRPDGRLGAVQGAARIAEADL